jgi:hypothetical protein
MFLYAIAGIVLASGLAAVGQQAPAPAAKPTAASYMQALKARVFLVEPSLEFQRYAPKTKGSPCAAFDHGFLVLFRYQGMLYEAAFYCDIPGMVVTGGGKQYGDRDLDGRIDMVLEGDDILFYDYAIVAPVTIGLERRTEFQYKYEYVLRLLDRVLPSSI